MNNRQLNIVIACGMLTAFLMVAPTQLGGLGMVLSLFTLVPLFVASLTSGPRTAVLAGIIATAAVAVTLGPLPAAASAVFTMLPTLYIGYIAGLSRDDNGDGQMEWYPLSSILFQVALISAATIIIYGAVTGYDPATAVERITTMLRETPGSTPELESMFGLMARTIPMVLPVSLVLLYLYSMSLAARLARRVSTAGAGLTRPKDFLPAAVALPLPAIGIFAGAVVAILLFGTTSLIGTAGMVVAGAFGAMFAAIGLATIHFLTIGMAARGVILFGVYLALLFVGFTVIVPLILGLAETLLGLRARRAQAT